MGRKPVVVINGRFLAQKPSGAQIYAFNLLDNAITLPEWTEFTWILAVPEKAQVPTHWLEAFDEIRRKGSLVRNPWDHFVLPSLIPTGALLISLASMPSIRIKRQLFCLHDVFPFVMPSVFNPLALKWYRWLYKRSINTFPFFVVSHYLARLVKQKFKKRPIDVIYPAGDHMDNIKTLSVDFPLPKLYVFVAGGNVAYRPIAPVIKALEILRKQGLDIHLLFTGSSNKLLYNLQDRDSYKPWVKRVSLPEAGHVKYVMQNAIAVVVPSLDETFGIPVAEAGVCKVPVIVSEAPGLSESGAPCLKFPVENPQILASHILALLTDYRFKKTYIQMLHSHSLKFTWKRSAHQFLKVVSRVTL